MVKTRLQLGDEICRTPKPGRCSSSITDSFLLSYIVGFSLYLFHHHLLLFINYIILFLFFLVLLASITIIITLYEQNCSGNIGIDYEKTYLVVLAVIH